MTNPKDMQREIKFRAWNHLAKRYEHDIHLMPSGKVLMQDGEEYDFVIEQFTGLKDKNEVPIFEGDTVKCEGICDTTEVFYDEHIGAWQPFAATHYPVKDWELTGNIHEAKGS